MQLYDCFTETVTLTFYRIVLHQASTEQETYCWQRAQFALIVGLSQFDQEHRRRRHTNTHSTFSSLVGYSHERTTQVGS